MGLVDDLKRIWFNVVHMDEMLANTAMRERWESDALRRDYYSGEHRKQLKVRTGQADDNIAINFAGLIVERGISMLLGKGVEFDLPGDPVQEEDPETGEIMREDQPNQQYIDAVWRANKKDILLHKTAQFGGINGTCYLKTVPDGAIDRETGEKVPRMIALDPMMMQIETNQEDIDVVLRYTMRFTVEIGNKVLGRKEVIERSTILVDSEGKAITDPNEEAAGFMDDGWIIQNYIEGANGKWELIDEEQWEYDFPPIIHWQNLPKAGDVYGAPDITNNVIELQDRINFVASNVSKIIRYHAHPKTWGRNAGSSSQQVWGADEMVIFQSDSALIDNLEMQSDLASSQQFLNTLRQSLFDITRTVDLASMKDKLGALTNFALRVLFYDSLAKLNSKQELYGEALIELNHRLLELAKIEPNGGGEVIWPEPLPSSEAEEITGFTFDLDRKLASKETVSTMRGYDWIEEKNRIAKESEEEQATSDNIGSILLRNFDRGLRGENALQE